VTPTTSRRRIKATAADADSPCMRRGFLVVAAGTLLLTGCHEYWDGSASGSDEPATTVASYDDETDPTAGDEQARTNVRAAIPAIEAWHADHSTYKGITVAALNNEYDRTIGDSIRLVGPFTNGMYCVESTVGSAAWHKAGPGGLVEGGYCPDRITAETAPPPPRASYGDAQTDLRAAVPAIEAWRLDYGSYAGMTTARLQAQYDYGIPSEIRVVRATKKTYCVETTVKGDTWSYWGARQGFRNGGC
jgi:hypothetical protein